MGLLDFWPIKFNHLSFKILASSGFFSQKTTINKRHPIAISSSNIESFVKIKPRLLKNFKISTFRNSIGFKHKNLKMNSTSKSSTSKKIQLQIQRHLKNTSRFNFKFRGCLKNTLRFKFKFENFCRALEDSKNN